MLRSPGLSATVCSRSTAEIHKPLPSRPRSVSMPSTPELPIELPGSILLENQGFPLQRAAHLAAPGPSTMRPARSEHPSSSSATPLRPSSSRVPQHKKTFSEASLQRRSKSKPNLITSPSSTDSKITACSVSTNGGHASSNESTKARVGLERCSLQPSPLIIERKSANNCNNGRKPQQEEETPDTPTPTTTRSRQIEELKSTITAQDNTISTLQAQFGSLRVSHEAHVASLIDAHAAEVASLKNYTRVLEEQQSQRTLHHASSNHLLLFLDSAAPQTPTRESPQTATAGSTSATSIRSFKTALEQPTRSPQVARDSPEMDNLKRKLSVARRPETGNRELVRELNLYKHNNAALQKQIESLMAKLNQAKTNERNLTATLEEIERNCTEWQAKASKVEQLEKSALALQNTIDHLEHRLELANTSKLDAEEHLLNLQMGRSPFDRRPTPPKLTVPESVPRQPDRQAAHMSMSTVFSAGSPTEQAQEPQDAATLAAFISHIERLQEQVKEKDSLNGQLEEENVQLRHKSAELERELRELNLQLEIQNQLLDKSKVAEVHIKELRSAIIQRESVIGEKEKALRMAERQLEHHKLLLHAEIRKHATLSLLADNQENPLPEPSSLASKADIDRWIERLRARFQKERHDDKENPPSNDMEALVKDLRREIDFYVREIIYYKLDIKGYKSDIKKLKHIASRMGSYGSRASDIDSPTPSQSRAADTPNPARLSTATSGLGISSTSSPVSPGPVSASLPAGRPITPAAPPTPDRSPEHNATPAFVTTKRVPLCNAAPMTPQTPPRKFQGTSEADPGVSPRSVARLSPERRKPTPPSPDQEKFGDMATNFPLSTPAAPKRHDTQRSMSDSIIQLYTMPRTPEWSPFSNPEKTPNGQYNVATQTRQRSASVPDSSKGKSTPERPPRPRYGLYETAPAPPSPPRVDVMAQAMRNSPDRAKTQEQAPHELNCGILSSTVSRIQDSGPSSSGSTSNVPAPLRFHSRASSAGSSTKGTSQPVSPSRKFSNSSGNNVPFIIGMPSPHNPALISPVTTVPPTACSITGKCATTTCSSKVQSPTSRTGVGGTMASSTPAVSPTEGPSSGISSYFGSGFPLAKSSSTSRASSITHTRNASLSMPSRKDSDSGGRSVGPSRNLSGSGIRNALNSQLPGLMMKGKGKSRKESLSISPPKPLESPFGVEVGEGGRGGEGEVGRAL
ncbi:uncharacterized protein EI97DRAFT_255805 [Westerdykella ornata]|uniref:Uncharacterized protein n=1 Tax=Westerdykella ornata TaxID=318751 RepID=A0A6A6JQF1_WESOR|nr:uncharacterized protein EI97DRAFT_255805 [Westerdykella ornata]KAF2278474.1 hypothetical protein EI97DRAFT_255805 [Westerdykella ornata]